MKNIIKTIIKIIFNKYLVASAIFVFVMFTNKDYNIRTRYKNAQTIQRLDKEINYYKTETEKNKKKLDLLQSNVEDLERFAREEFMMHKLDEDVYVVVEK